MDDIGILTRRPDFLAGFLLESECSDEFNALYQELLNNHQPVGVVERHLVSDITISLWRLQRVRSWDPKLDHDFRVADRLIRYRSGILDQLNRATVLLKKLQKDRTKPPRKAKVIPFPRATVKT